MPHMNKNNKENQNENLLKRKEKKMWVASRPSNQSKESIRESRQVDPVIQYPCTLPCYLHYFVLQSIGLLCTGLLFFSTFPNK